MSFLSPDHEWDQLEQFIGAYLHEDWQAEYSTVQEAIVDAAPDFDHHLLAEFDRVRVLGLDDDGYDEMLQRLGCALIPATFAMTPSQLWAWLESLMRAELARNPKRP